MLNRANRLNFFFDPESIRRKEEWRFAVGQSIDLCVCVFENVTLHPASNLRRHDGLRSLLWLFEVAVEEELDTKFG